MILSTLNGSGPGLVGLIIILSLVIGAPLILGGVLVWRVWCWRAYGDPLGAGDALIAGALAFLLIVYWVTF